MASKRYMLVTYAGKPNGKWDELTDFKDKVTLKDKQLATVILDLHEKTVVKNRLNPDADFEILLEMYKRLLGDQLTPHLPMEEQIEKEEPVEKDT